MSPGPLMKIVKLLSVEKIVFENQDVTTDYTFRIFDLTQIGGRKKHRH